MVPFKLKLKGNRARWLIDLRWIAVVFVVLATFVSSRFLGIALYESALYVLAGILLVLNGIYKFLQRAIAANTLKILNEQSLIILQIVTDLILLTFLLHFTGGVENPFIIYYFFHLMIASILLPRRIGYMIATFMLLLVGSMTLLEFQGILPHYHLKGFLTGGFYHNLNYLAGTGFVFVTTSYVVVYMTGTISAKLREAEKASRLANRQLEEKDKIKDEYVYRLSHDIKGHIAAIKSSLDASLIQNEPEKIKKFSRMGLNRTELITDFLGNLLRITRLRLNKESEQSDFSLGELLTRVVDLYREQADEKKIRLVTGFRENNRKCRGNRVSLEEAFTNLLQNAIKYTPPGGEVSIRLGIVKNTFVAEIEDTGIGIPEDEIKSIFREFFRASNARQQLKEGDGLGLAITRQIIENHNGKISVKSRENEGTTFTVKLACAN